jgi:serine/threonine-protein kinase RsbW
MGLAKRKRDGHGDDERAARVKGKSSATAAAGATAGAPSGPGAIATKVNGSLRFEFHSNFDTGCDVQTQILKEVERHGFNPNSLFATRLALEEAMVNAIKHGNKLDPTKKVFVEARVTRDRVEIEIEDQGPGFSRKSVPDPTAEENLCKCSGRGILLIEAYMNSVSWSRGGRRVHMVRLNEPSELPERT